MPCPSCFGAGWICERHPDQPWPHEGCSGAGEPCPACNTSNPTRTDFDLSIARVEDDVFADWPPAPPQAERPTETLFEFTRADGKRITCELGFEARATAGRFSSTRSGAENSTLVAVSLCEN